MGKKAQKKLKKALRKLKAGVPQGYAQANGNAMAGNGGIFGSLKKVAPSQQFLIGALAGAAAAYLMTDEELRGRLIKAGIKLYANMAGGFEEVKEQMADMRAEVEAERHGAL